MTDHPTTDDDRCPTCRSGRLHRLSFYDGYGNATGRCADERHDRFAAARIREPEAAGDGSLERLTTEGTRHPFIIGRAMDHYSDDVVVARRCLQRLCDLVTTVTAERDRLIALGNALADAAIAPLVDADYPKLTAALDAWANR